jgi:hypothetical protein
MHSTRSIARRTVLRGGIVGGVGLLAGCLGGETVRSDETRVFDVAEAGTVADGVSKLALYSQQGDVRIQPTDGSAIRIDLHRSTRSGRKALTAAKLEVTRRGDTLELRGVRETRNWLTDGPQVSMDMDVFVPTTGSVTVEVARVETKLGDIGIDGVRGAPELVTDMGDVRVATIDGFSRIDGDGDVTVDLRSLRDGVTSLIVDSGDVTLRVDPALSCDLDVSVEHGEIVVEGLPFTDVVDGDRTFAGRLGPGGRRLTVTCEHGDVYLYSITE